MNPFLEVEDLHKSYGSFHALKGVSFSVHAGEIISVLGPSGCGKSTLLQLIAGLQQPDAGSIRFRGEVVSSPSRFIPPEKRRINMVFQDYALWPHMNVYENIAYGLRRQKVSPLEMKKRVSELVSLLHLDGLENRLPSQLSGGQQQRVAIARALATQPDLILLDEPLSNLDMRLRIEMRTEMAYLFRKLQTTVLHVTHDPAEAFAMANRLIIMGQGKIDQMDRPEICYANPSTPSIASLLGASNHLTGRRVSLHEGTGIRVGEETILGKMPGLNGNMSPRSLQLLFRPDDVVWVEEGKENASFGGEPLNSNRLPVRVVLSAFEGSRYRILAETLDGQSLSFFHLHPLETEQKGWIWIPPKNAFLYSLDDERSIL
ncbi:ABC transporter ATP-binding protein [Thermicanus aegyptius]|uniref:ABC transporter ATP-binding protein n=1 Tax=Thermicanus aegyptius TaxID=94009 RepID=UPI00040598DA|nr:ABC transporter ATP-binding protein [Thermicanus aegyptius]